MHRLVAALLAAFSLAAAPLEAQEPATPVYAEGRMLVMVAPEFPEKALARGESARVMVSGTIRTTGRLDNIRIEAKPPSEAFESAVMEVAHLWRLQPRIVSPECGATEAPARIELWFETADGKPKVSFTPSRPLTGTVTPEIFRDRKPLRFTLPRYPAVLARDPRTPKLVVQLVYLGVAGDGAVTNVTVAPLLFYRDFEPHIVAAARHWKFAPQDRSWCAELELRFDLSE